MLTDHERVLLKLKAHVASKKSHGQRDLLATIAALEAECAVEEGLPEKALRLFGNRLSEDLLRQEQPQAAGNGAAGAGAHA